MTINTKTQYVGAIYCGLCNTDKPHGARLTISDPVAPSDLFFCGECLVTTAHLIVSRDASRALYNGELEDDEEAAA